MILQASSLPESLVLPSIKAVRLGQSRHSDGILQDNRCSQWQGNAGNSRAEMCCSCARQYRQLAWPSQQTRPASVHVGQSSLIRKIRLIMKIQLCTDMHIAGTNMISKSDHSDAHVLMQAVAARYADVLYAPCAVMRMYTKGHQISDPQAMMTLSAPARHRSLTCPQLGCCPSSAPQGLQDRPILVAVALTAPHCRISQSW